MTSMGVSMGRRLGSTVSISLAGDREAVPISRLSFANASERYIEYGGSMTGPFAANIPAIRVIGGKTYVQIEGAKGTLNAYSENMLLGLDNASNLDVSSDTGADPLGGATADKLIENAVDNTHIRWRNIDGLLLGSSYAISGFGKIDERSQVRVTFAGCFNTAYVDFDIVAMTATLAGGVAASYGIRDVGGGYCYWYASKVSEDNGTGTFMIQILNGGVPSYQGITGYGLYLWGMNVVASHYPTSYIKAVATPVTRSADEAFLAAADVPSWLRNTGYKKDLIFMYDSVQLAAEGTDKVIDCFDTTAETIAVKLASNGKIYIDGSVSGNLFTSAVAHTWSAQQTCSISVRYNNGANCVVTTSGFTTGNATQTGTAFAVADGNIYTGMTDAIGSHCNGLMSMWEPL